MDSSTSSLREIFADAAVIAEPAERAAYLDRACRGNDLLRARVERLLEADDEAGKFLKYSSDTTTSLAPSEKPGDRIGRYRLIERIGRGGGGVVYLAEQEEPVRRRVALKILKLGLDTQSFVARFEAERQALAMMDHPNIARVLDAGATERGRPFFVMEFVSGQRLSEYCEQHRLSLCQRLQLFVSVCHAVQHAHQKGIIHRDLKPSNILVSDHEGVAVPKVIDFGIAKATGQGEMERGSLTSMNHLLGTPAYMSPEQMDLGAQDVDTRTDIYSLGVVLYELLTGKPPFELVGADFEEMRRLIRDVDPLRPSTRITKNLDKSRAASPVSRDQMGAIRGDLDWIVMKCLEKDRRRRYDTANGLAMDIRRHLEHEPVFARPPSQFYRLQKIVRRHRLVFGAIGAVALVLIAGLIVSAKLTLKAQHAEQEQNRLRAVAQAEAAESRQLLVRRYVAEGNRLAEENKVALGLPWLVQALALEAGDPGREPDERLRIAQTLVDAPQLLLNVLQGNSVNCVVFSPDGNLVATGSDDGVVRISELVCGGDTNIHLTLDRAIGRVAFSPDGARLAAVDLGGHARVWSSSTGEALTPVLRADDFDESLVSDQEPWLKPALSFSPDGKLLLVACASKSAQLRDASTGTLVREFTHDQVVYHAAFSPDGRYVVTTSKDGTAQVWEVDSGKAACPPLKDGGKVVWAQFSSDGKEILTMRDRHYVQLWDWRSGRQLTREIPRRSELYRASLSPDGNSILTTAWSGYAELYDAGSGRTMRLFQQQGGLVDAAFSPDGNYIATACEDGNAWIWSVADATDHPMPLPQGNHIEEIAFSPDSRRLAVVGRGGCARVWELSPAQRGVRRLPGNNVDWVCFDNSGRRALVLSSGPPGFLGIYEIPSGKLVGKVPLSHRQITHARFSPDDRRILAFGSGRNAFILDADTGAEVFPPLAHDARVEDALWSPDGKLAITAAGPAGAMAWDSNSGKLVTKFSSSNPITSIALSPDGTRLATGQADNTVQFWAITTGRRVGATINTQAAIRQIEFSPDGKRLAIATDVRNGEGVVEMRGTDSGQLVGQPLVHRDNVAFFEFSRDGRWLATACSDHTARVWDAATGKPVSPLLTENFEGRIVAFSPDGQRLATLARRGAARLWNAQTGEPLSPPIEYPRNEGNGWMSYSPDGRRLLLARGGNEAWLRELQPETASVQELKLLGEVLSCTRFDSAAGMVPLDQASLDQDWKELRALRLQH